MRMHHNAGCPKESFSATKCNCGFVQEFLESARTAERVKNAALIPAQYAMLPDTDMRPLLDLTELLESLRERSRNHPALKDE